MIELSDVRTSEIPCLGLMGLSGVGSPEEINDYHIRNAVTTLSAAFNNGYVMFDLADIYSRGASEEMFRICLEELKPERESMYVATKCGIRLDEGSMPYHYDGSYDHIMRSFEASMKRLGLAYIDLYQIHRRDPFTHPAETARALNQLVDEGLVRRLGVSNYGVTQIRALQQYLEAPLVSVQSEFSLLHLDPMDDGVFDYCEQTGMHFLAYSPIKKGMVLGHHVSDALRRRSESLLPELEAMAMEKRVSAVQLALAWVQHMPLSVIPVYGSNNPGHVAEAAYLPQIDLTHLEWYRLWKAALGTPLP